MTDSKIKTEHKPTATTPPPATANPSIEAFNVQKKVETDKKDSPSQK